MTTHDTPDPTDAAPDATDVPSWSLDEGPLADDTLSQRPDCRQSVFDPYDDAFDLPGPVDPPGPSVRGPVDVDWLDRLLDHLAARVPTEGCDNRLTLTQQWARREGMSQDGVADSLRDLGAYCDCEVLMNAPRSRGAGR